LGLLLIFPEEFCGAYAKGLGELTEHRCGRAALSALNPADVAHGQAGFTGQGLLGQTAGFSETS
jgi:hypothetical protein